MTLALECVRHARTAQRAAWLEPLRFGDSVARDIRRACDRAIAQSRPVYLMTRDERRLLRARLGLALRVLLRADAGDFGRWKPCRWCDLPGPWSHRFGCPGSGEARSRMLVRPLWESAPPHEASR
jgi:hypothetical protein